MKTFSKCFVPAIFLSGANYFCFLTAKKLECSDKEKENKKDHSSKDDSSTDSSSSDYESSMTMPSEWAVFL